MTILDTTCPVNRLLDETPMPAWSQTFTFLDGEWHEGNHPFVGARTHAFWLGSSVFDGARAFEGVTPDLDKHFARLNRSAETMCLTPTMSVEAMLDLAKEGLKKFSPGAELYIRPMYWPEGGSATSAVAPDADSTRFCLCIYEAPLPAPTGVSITRSPYAKPLAVTMPIEAKAGCLYPNNGRALIEARARGFDNCLMCDMIGNVAELATANIFMARDGVVMTPIANGSFLSGVTRQRVIELLRADGKDAREATLGFADFDGADEIFVVGNYGKVTPVRRIDGRDLQPGPFFHRARKLYWEYAHSC
jgi:branched-chain amino acid aminotransferase